MIVTALADRDQAIRDLVRSAFGHNGQKCSAASLAICEAEVYDDPTFRRQLRDAAASLAVGWRWDPASRITPLTQPPGAAPAARAHDARRGRGVAARAAPGSATTRASGHPDQARRPPGSFFHRTECFGPVLGLMRADDLDEAIHLAERHAVRPHERPPLARRPRGRRAGTSASRPATSTSIGRSPGAIVRRQPFGGWKPSSFGPGAKAGGPNYVLQLARWRQASRPSRATSAPADLADLLHALPRPWATQRTGAVAARRARQLCPRLAGALRVRARPERLLGEHNVFRYRPCRGVLVRDELASRERAGCASLACSSPPASAARR